MAMTDYLKVEIAFGATSYQTAGLTWVDVAADVLTIKATSSRRRGLEDKFTSGQAVIVLRDDDRDYDPSFASSPYVGDFVWGTPVRIISGSVVAWSGWCYSFTPDRTTGRPTCEIVARDALAVLAETELAEQNEAGEGDTVDARIGDILDLANFPSANRDIDPGGNTLQATTYGTSALKALTDAAQAGGGIIYSDPALAGASLVYEDRHGVRLRSRMASQPATVSFGIGESNSIVDGSLRLASVGDWFRNIAVVQPNGDDTTYTAGSVTSLQAPKEIKIRTPSAVGSQAQGLADFWQGVYSASGTYPQTWETEFVTHSSAVNQYALVAQLRDRATVTWEGGAETAEVFITGIRHRINGSEWRVTYTAEPAAPYDALSGAADWLVLDDATDGLVGTHKLGY